MDFRMLRVCPLKLYECYECWGFVVLIEASVGVLFVVFDVFVVLFFDGGAMSSPGKGEEREETGRMERSYQLLLVSINAFLLVGDRCSFIHIGCQNLDLETSRIVFGSIIIVHFLGIYNAYHSRGPEAACEVRPWDLETLSCEHRHDLTTDRSKSYDPPFYRRTTSASVYLLSARGWVYKYVWIQWW